ncbi:MAG TPA: 30S ribosomal protein S20 [Candidatus Saccharimonadales bacterium]
MPIIKSAKKRVKVAKKAAIRNSKTKRSLKDAVKAFHRAITGKTDAKPAQSKAQSAIDTAAKKGVMHKNKAARKKSQLAKAAKSASEAKPVTKKPTTKKVAATKTATKKVAAKKPAAKKTVKK